MHPSEITCSSLSNHCELLAFLPITLVVVPQPATPESEHGVPEQQQQQQEQQTQQPNAEKQGSGPDGEGAGTKAREQGSKKEVFLPDCSTCLAWLACFVP